MSKKLIAIALAGLFVFSAVSVKADTISDLQAQITALMTQINALQAQITGAGTGTVCFNTDLQKGMTSDDVKNLQIKLAVTPTSGYFGPITFAAVKTFQTAHGIINTGYVGPLTRTALNALYCTPTTTTTTEPVSTVPGCEVGDLFSRTTGAACTTTTTVAAPSYGTLSVVSYPVSSPVSTFYAGGNYELFAGQFKATGSDITVKKVGFDLNVSPAGGNIFPWQVFSTVSVWDGATQLAEVAVTQSNLIQDTFASKYYLNISGFNLVIPNGQQKVLTVKATLLSPMPSAVGVKGYTVTMNTGIVYSDTAGVTYSSVTVPTLTKTISNILASNAANLTASLASDNPLENNVIASTGATSKVDVLKFNVKNDSDVSATLNNGSALVTVENATTTAYVTAVELWDDTALVASAGPTSWVNSSSTVSWDNFTLPIADNITKTLTVKAVIAQIPTTDTTFVPGSWVKASSIGFTGIDTNSNVVPSDPSTFTALVGQNQHIYVKAPSFAFVTSKYAVTGSNPNSGKTNDIADTSITFTITANNSDIFIDAATGSTSTLLLTTSTSTPSDTLSCNSPAEDTSHTGYWKIPAGSTVTCELTTHIVNTIPYAAGFAAVKIKNVAWNTTNAYPVSPQTYGFTVFKTSNFYLGN